MAQFMSFLSSGLCEADRCPKLHAFLDDARRFTLHNRSLIEQAPLQIYCSALVFVPNNSIIRRNSESDVPTWIQMKPKVQADWDAARQTLEDHSGGVTSVAFSNSGQYLKTDRGSFRLTPPDTSSSNDRDTADGFSVVEEWITKNEMGVLWLPPDYRAACVAVSKAVVVFGQRSGRISTFQFAPGSGLVL